MKSLKNIFIFSVLIIAVLLGSIHFIPWDRVNWGKIEMLPGSAITVTGQAKQDVKNQIARFSAGVTVTAEDKQVAVDEVNLKMTDLIAVIKDFGIADKDIKTRTISVNEFEDQPMPPVVKTVKKWRASNSISITLRDIDESSSLADLLNTTGATDVHGPNFALDDTQPAEIDLMEAAIDNAREKAEAIAKASHRKLGKVLSVNEGISQSISPLYRSMEIGMDEGEPTPVEPGSATVSKTVTVIFELK